MKINLNSSPTYLPKSLEGLEQGFGFYEGNDFNKDNDKKHLQLMTSFVRCLNTISSKVNLLKVDSNSENFLKRAAENINFLKTVAPQPFIDNVKVQLNLETNINSFLKTTFGLISELFPKKSKISNYSYSMYRRLSEQENYSQSHAYENKYRVVLSGGLNDFFSRKMSEGLGLEKTFDFIFLHEVSHSIQFFNMKDDFKMSFVENLCNKFQRALNLKPNYLEKVNQESGSHGLFTTIDSTIASSLYSLHKEVYADTSALLLMRNKSILDGNYNKEEMLATCINVKNVRAQVCHPLHFSGITNASKSFSHSTTISLDEVANKINQLGRQELSPEEIHDFSSSCANQALARSIIILTNSHNEEFIPVLNTAFCLAFDIETGEGHIETENRAEKYQAELKKLQSIAGLEWVEQLEKNLKEFDSGAKPGNHWSLKGTQEQIKEKMASVIHMIGFEVIKPDEQINIKDIKSIASSDITPAIELNQSNINPVSVAPSPEINFKEKIKNYRNEPTVISSPSLTIK